MAKRSKSRFVFDPGWKLDGPEELGPVVEKATQDVIELDKRAQSVIDNQLRQAGKSLAELDRKTVNQIDGRLAEVGGVVDRMENNIQSTLMNDLGGVAQVLEAVGITPDAGQGAPSVASLPTATDSALQSGADIGSFQQPPAAKQQVAAQQAQPGGCPPNPGQPGGEAIVFLDCRTMTYQATCWNDPAVSQPWALISNVLGDLMRAGQVATDLNNQVPISTRCSVCARHYPPSANNAVCNPAPPPNNPLPPPAPQPAPQPPSPTPQPYPQPNPLPPTQPCPPTPATNYCVGVDQTGCVFTAYDQHLPTPANVVKVVACGLTQAAAAQIATALSQQVCQQVSPNVPTPKPGAGSPDPLCDPLGYCVYMTSGKQPISPGSQGAGGPLEQIWQQNAASAANEIPFIRSVTQTVLNGIFGFVGTLAGYFDKILLNWKWPSCANKTALIQAHTNLVVHDILSIFLGGSFRRLGVPNEYIANASCPILFPDQDAATKAYLTGSIDLDTMQCWVAMNDYCNQPWSAVVDSQARRVSIDEAAALWFRGAITDLQYQQAARRNGVLDPAEATAMLSARQGKFGPAEAVRLGQRGVITPNAVDGVIRTNGFTGPLDVAAWTDLATPYFDPDRALSLWRRGYFSDAELADTIVANGFVRSRQLDGWKELAKFVPPYTDLVRFMVRDAADDTLATQFNLDAELPQKYKGKLPIWAKAQGVDDEVMKFVWRAHWTIPSPGQLYQIYHRFRHPIDPSGLTIKRSDIEAALAQQDIAPFWRPYLLEMSFHPLTRVDTRRAYELGVIDSNGVYESYLRQGYSDDDAQTLQHYTEVQLLEKLKRSPQVNKTAKLEWTVADLRQWLQIYNLPQTDVDLIVDEALARAAQLSRSICVKNMRKRFHVGDIAPQDALTTLVNLGYDPAQASAAVASWQCELSSKSKQAQASQLCKWWQDGLVTEQEVINRLGVMGWSQMDAIRIMASCHLRKDERDAKVAEKRRKELEQQLKQQQAAADKAAAAQQRAADNAAKTAAAEARREAVRDANFLKFSRAYADNVGVGITSAYATLKAAMDSATATYGLDVDQGITIVGQAVIGFDPAAGTPIDSRIDDLARALAAAASTPQP